MKRFVIKKSVLPCLTPWGVLDTETGLYVVEYKIQEFAEKACQSFNQYGLPDTRGIPPPVVETTWNTASKRIEHPEGNPLHQKKPQHSDKRRIELD